MKKNYFLLLLTLSFATITNAQVIFSSDFSDASYDAEAVQTIANDHADWVSEAKWKANTNDQLEIVGNWNKMILDKKITASSGDFISADINIVFGNDGETLVKDQAMLWLGFKSNNNLTDWYNREGVLVKSVGTDLSFGSQSANANVNAGPAAVAADNANGSGAFDADPTITGTLNTVINVKIEIGVGADAASSTISVKVNGNIGTVTGIDPELYTDITTPANGVWLMSWAYGFAASGATKIYYEDLKVEKTSASVLSTEKFNSFEFNTYPNPVNDVLFINSKENIQSAEVFNLLGKKVLSTNNVQGSLEVSSLSKSIYILKLTSDKGISTTRFVKK